MERTRPAWMFAPPEPLLRPAVAMCVAAACTFAAQPAWCGSPALLDADDVALRHDLAWLADRGVLELSLGSWPMTVSLAEDAIAQCDCTGLYPEDLDAMARVRQALERARSRAVRLAARVNSARHPAVDAAAPALGRAGSSLAAQQSNEQWAVRLQINTVSEPLTTSGEEVTLDDSYAAVNGPGFVAMLGAFGRWWGPGQYSSLVLSNAAPPVPALVLRRAAETPSESPWLRWIGPWSWEVSAGRPRHYEPGSTTTLAMRLTARPLPGLELAASRYLYWGGEGQPESPGSLARALLGNSNIDDPDKADPGNELAGLDLRWAPPILLGPTVAVYGQLIGEDEASGPSHLASTFGLQVKLPMSGHRVELTLEASDTVLGRLWGTGSSEHRSAAYHHSTYVAGHYHQGLPVGAYFGGGGRAFSAGLDWVPPDNGHALRWHARAWKAALGELGNESLNTLYGRSGTLTGGLLRVQGQAGSHGPRWHAAVSLQRYPAGPRRSWGLQAGMDMPLFVAD